jgi:uncharacterized repeat protein (TIGR01451 family)
VKRYRFITALVVTLLLTQAFAGMAEAQSSGVANPGTFNLVKTDEMFSSERYGTGGPSAPELMPTQVSFATPNGTVNSNGTFSFGQTSEWQNVPDVIIDGAMEHRIRTNGTTTGTIDPLTGVVTMNMTIRHIFKTGESCVLIIFCSDRLCFIQYPVSLTTEQSGALQGTRYDRTTGLMTLVSNTHAVPQTTNTDNNCDGAGRSRINDTLQLPKPAGTNRMIITLRWNQRNPQPRGDIAIRQSAGPLMEHREANIFVTPHNAGSQTISGPFTTTSVLPTGLTPLSAEGDGYDCTIFDRVVECRWGEGDPGDPGDPDADPPIAPTPPGPPGTIAPFSDAPTLTIRVAAGEVYPEVEVTSTIAADNPASDVYTPNNTSTITIPVEVPDLVMTKTAERPTFTVNRQERYSLVVSNINAPTVQGEPVTVVDTVPSELAIQSVTGAGWNCSLNGQEVTCTRAAQILENSAAPPILIDVIPQGTTQNYSVTNTATVSTAREVNLGDNSSTLVTEVGYVDMTVAKQAVPSVFTHGQPAEYQVTATNNGTRATYGPTTIIDTLPPGVNFVSAAGSGWSCNMTQFFGSQVVTCTRPAAVEAGESAPPVRIEVQVPSTTVGNITNSVTVTTQGDPNPNNNDFTLVTEVRPPLPDISPNQFTDGQPVVGEPIQRRFNVENNGTGPTLGPITVLHAMPTGFDLQNAAGPGWSCGTQTVNAQTVLICNYQATLQQGQTTPDVTYTAQVGPAAYPETRSSVTTATQSEPGDLTDDNTDVEMIEVWSNDLAIEKTSDDFVLGESGTYFIDVTNVGEVPTRNTTTVTDELPEGISYTGFTGAGWNCTADTSGDRDDVTCTRNDLLAPGDSFPTLDLQVDIGDDAWPETTNTATVDTQYDLNRANSTDSVTTTVRAPDLAIDKSAGDLVAGQTGTFFIDVENVGNADTVADTVVTDLLPEGTSYSEFDGDPWVCDFEEVDGRDEVSCTNADLLAPGEAHDTLEIHVDVSVDAHPEVLNRADVSTERDLNDENDADQTTAPVRAADLAVTKSVNGFLSTGYPGSFTIEVDNVGDADTANTVTVFDMLPVGLTYTGFSGAGWDCDSEDQLVTCTTDEVAEADGSLTDLVIDVDVEGDPGDYQNVASVQYPHDPNEDNNTHVLAFEVYEPLVDLAIEKSSDDDFVYGGSGTYTIQVTNVGLAANEGDMIVTDELPEGLEFSSVDGGDDWTCDEEDGTVTCTSSTTLAPEGGEADPILLTVDVREGAFPEVSNTAVVDTPREIDPTNNTDTDTRPVTAADFAITKDASAFNLGDTGTFTIGVSNIGDADAIDGVTVTDVLPDGVSVDSFSGDGWDCGPVPSDAGDTIECTNDGALDAGDSYDDIVFTVSLDDDAWPGFENTATVDGPWDVDLANNTATAAVDVSRPDMAVVKDHNGPLHVGENGTYTIMSGNEGDGRTTGPITIVDVLPAGLSYVSATGTGWNCSAEGQIVTCSRSDNVAPMTPLPEITLTVGVGTTAWPEVLNPARVTTEWDGNEDNDLFLNTRPVHAPDLAISKSHDGYFTVGDGDRYRIDVENVGENSTVSTITVVDLLPEGINFLGTEGPFNCQFTIQGNRDRVSCTTDEVLDPEESITLMIDVVADEAAMPSVENIASVSTQRDPNQVNDVAVDPTDVFGPAADLALDKSHVGDFVVGDLEEYHYAVTNVRPHGSDGDVTLIDDLPEGISVVGFDAPGWECSTLGGDVNCVLEGPVAASQELPVVVAQVTASMAAQEASPVDSFAEVLFDPDPFLANNTDNDPTVVRHIDLSVDKFTADPDDNADNGENGDAGEVLTVALEDDDDFDGSTAAPGDEIRYAVNVTNIGTAPTIGGLTLVDELPAALELIEVTSMAGWTCDTEDTPGTATSVRIECVHDGLAEDEVSGIQIDALIDPGFTGTLTNTAEATTALDSDLTNNVSTATVEVAGPIDPVPGSPTITGITPGNGTLSVAFLPPEDDGGRPITNYEYSLNGGQSWNGRSPAGAGSPLVIGGLINGTTYSVTIRAVTEAGPGAASNSMEGTPGAAPSAPTELAAIPRDGGVRVQWQPPAENNGFAITGYSVTANTGQNCSTGRGGRGCVVTGLTNGTTYTFSVVATNARGESPAATIRSRPRTVPTAPRDLTVSSTQPRTINASWQRPENNGGAPINRYVVRCQPVNPDFATRRAETTTRNAVVTGVRRGERYRCQVRAFNVAGGGPWSTRAVLRTF